MADPITFGSVCSGIEAASAAWSPLGWEAAWLAEIEPFPCAVLAHHHPVVPNLGDMTTIEPRVRAAAIEAPDVFTGGTPCQAFSVAGKRESLADARGNLSLTFVEIADAIDDVRAADGREPCVVVWENVPGVLSTADNAFGCFLGALAGSGCELQPPGGKWNNAGLVLGPRRAVAWRILDAQFFGLAQRRRRVFVVASARDGFDPGTILFEFDGVRRDSAPRREAREETASGAGSGAEVSGGAGPGLTGTIAMASGQSGAEIYEDGSGPTLTCLHEAPIVAKTILAGGNTNNPLDETLVAHTLRGEGFDASEDGTGRGTPLVPVVSGPLGAGDGNRGWRNDLDGAAFVPVLAPVVCRDIAATLGGRMRGQDDACADNLQPMAFMADDYKTGSFAEVDVAGPLTTTADRTRGAPIAFSSKDHGADAGEIAPTLRVMGHDGSHANGGGQVAVAVDCYNHAISGACAGSLTTTGGPPLSGPGVMQGMAVRRLTPVECERLQGFPDNHTLIPWRGKPAELCPDGPRYKALGNSWAVPCARWIGQRIDQALQQGRAA
ncbi:MAG TPA: DNA cytosine methyltransferase [Arenimonas sp.]